MRGRLIGRLSDNQRRRAVRNNDPSTGRRPPNNGACTDSLQDPDRSIGSLMPARRAHGRRALPRNRDNRLRMVGRTGRAQSASRRPCASGQRRRLVGDRRHRRIPVRRRDGGCRRSTLSPTTTPTLHRDSFRYIVDVSETHGRFPSTKDFHMNTPFTPPPGPLRGAISASVSGRLQPQQTVAPCTSSVGKPVANSANTSVSTARRHARFRPRLRRLRLRARLRSRLRLRTRRRLGFGGRSGRRGGRTRQARRRARRHPDAAAPTGRCTATR